MTAFNVVRFRVKPGREKEFISLFKKADRGFAGMRRISMIKTGENSYCSVGEWGAFDNIVAARPVMIELLNSFRDCLEDLGGGLGVTDPVSGSTVFELSGSAGSKPKTKSGKSAARKKPAAGKKPARKKAAKRRKRK
jgi:hypothetical protein